MYKYKYVIVTKEGRDRYTKSLILGMFMFHIEKMIHIVYFKGQGSFGVSIAQMVKTLKICRRGTMGDFILDMPHIEKIIPVVLSGDQGHLRSNCKSPVNLSHYVDVPH